MFKSFELGTEIEVPYIPYPYNRVMLPIIQRLHWVMVHIDVKHRPHILAMAVEHGRYEILEGHEFLMSVPTSDPDHDIAYFCVGQMSDEFRLVLQEITQGQEL